jgi:2-polyprenyl-3-methyl-5-hydroxy-6-metoxy-1,4-benzoquinol methylase
MKKVKSRLYDYLLTGARKSARVRNIIYKLYHHLNLQEVSRVRLLKERDRRLDTLKNQTIFSEQDYEFLRQADFPLLWRLIRERDWRIISRISPDQTVLNGPFEGLKFPAMDIKEINLASKITGSYESELHAVVEEICLTPYRDVLDVGCAEGYYAVGFARRLRQATVHAFDIDEHSRRFAGTWQPSTAWKTGWCYMPPAPRRR